MVVRQPLELTGNLTSFDIMVNIHGGGESGQAGAVRHGITRALIDYDAALKPVLRMPGWSRATRAKWSGRRLAYARRAGVSNFPSDNRLHARSQKAAFSGGFFICYFN